MNELQLNIAMEAIRTLGNQNGHSEISRLKGLLHQNFGFENRGEIAFVLSKLEKDYEMIYQQNNWYCLSIKGDTAIKIGIDRYFKKINSSHRIDLEMKRLEIISKVIDIAKNIKTFVIIAIETTIIIAMLLERLLRG